MRRHQDITVPRDDTRRVELTITDTSGETADEPTNLTGKRVRWALYKNSRTTTPVLEYTNDDPELAIEDASGGVVSLHLDSDETSPEYDNYRHYFYVVEDVGDETDQWTVATGILEIE